MKEEWRQVPGYSKYLISSKGRVWSSVRNQLLAFSQNEHGYLRVGLYSDTGKRSIINVNRIVCTAFHGPPPTPLHQAAHEDGVNTHNFANNLSWKTPQGNMDDRIRHGTTCAGDTHPCSKTNSETVTRIRSAFSKHMIGRHRDGFERPLRGFYPRLAKHYGVTVATAKDIVQKRSWK